jgi:hypothetical protein
LKTNAASTFRTYPNFISTLILCDYIQEHLPKKQKGIYDYSIDDLEFKVAVNENVINECLVNKNGEIYDYFCKIYTKPRLR